MFCNNDAKIVEHGSPQGTPNRQTIAKKATAARWLQPPCPERASTVPNWTHKEFRVPRGLDFGRTNVNFYAFLKNKCNFDAFFYEKSNFGSLLIKKGLSTTAVATEP